MFPQSSFIKHLEIVQLLKQRDMEAFLYVADCYTPAFFYMLLPITKNIKVSREIITSTFMLAHKQMNQYSDAEHYTFFMWLIGIMISYLETDPSKEAVLHDVLMILHEIQ